MPDVSSSESILIESYMAETLLGLAPRRGQLEKLQQAALGAFGQLLPHSPRCIRIPDGTFLWAGPERWLALGAAPLESTVRAALGKTAILVEQADSRVLFRVSGPRVLTVLEKLVPIDLHVREFAQDATALTRVADVSVQLWRARELPGFEIALPRSFAVSFQQSLRVAAHEFGVTVRPARAGDSAGSPVAHRTINDYRKLTLQASSTFS